MSEYDIFAEAMAREHGGTVEEYIGSATAFRRALDPTFHVNNFQYAYSIVLCDNTTTVAGCRFVGTTLVADELSSSRTRFSILTWDGVSPHFRDYGWRPACPTEGIQPVLLWEDINGRRWGYESVAFPRRALVDTRSYLQSLPLLWESIPSADVWVPISIKPGLGGYFREERPLSELKFYPPSGFDVPVAA